MKICVHCKEPIEPNEIVPNTNLEIHRECLLRSIIGSLAHQQRKCSCYGGEGEDNKNLTVRENAKASADFFNDRLDKAAKAKFN